jgi:hypothetical protein
MKAKTFIALLAMTAVIFGGAIAAISMTHRAATVSGPSGSNSQTYGSMTCVWQDSNPNVATCTNNVYHYSETCTRNSSNQAWSCP